MSHQRHPRSASRQRLGLSSREYAILARLSTPHKIQRFISAIPINHEIGGETVLSVRGVLAQRRAHCIEAAFVAACALWIHGDAPLVMHMACAEQDYPHVVALYRRRKCWGAISKSNGTHLRHRDPIYRSLRELAMSYFNEYHDGRGRKTLRGYSASFDLGRVAPDLWVTASEACWEVHNRLAALRHYALVTPAQVRSLATLDAFERQTSRIVEYPRPH